MDRLLLQVRANKLPESTLEREGAPREVNALLDPSAGLPGAFVRNCPSIMAACPDATERDSTTVLANFQSITPSPAPMHPPFAIVMARHRRPPRFGAFRPRPVFLCFLIFCFRKCTIPLGACTCDGASTAIVALRAVRPFRVLACPSARLQRPIPWTAAPLLSTCPHAVLRIDAPLQDIPPAHSRRPAKFPGC